MADDDDLRVSVFQVPRTVWGGRSSTAGGGGSVLRTRADAAAFVAF